MGTFTVTIHTDNAAFDEWGGETARILREIAQAVLDHAPEPLSMPLRDSNGNTCGAVEWRE